MKNDKAKPTGETHILDTVPKIVEVATVENMERLIADIGAAIRFAVAARLMYPTFTMPHIKWTDDGVEGLSGFSVNRKREKR